MLATRISFVNELALLAGALGADIAQVRQAMATDVRIGPHFLFPGPGYGGSCFPKDVSALIETGRSAGHPMELIAAGQRVNERQKRVLGEKVVARFGEDLSGRTFAVWGLAFKPKTDDMREAPAIPLIEELLSRGGAVVAYDPEAMRTAEGIFGERIRLAADNYEALSGADALVLVTEWTQFRRPNFERMRELLKSSVIFDGRNIYNGPALRKLGFEYFSL